MRFRSAVPAMAAITLALILPVSLPRAQATAPWLTTGRSEVALSPNGDGRADEATVVFHLAKKASVKAEIVGVRRLGTTILKPGRHTVAWDGLDDRGRLVGDGLYRLKLSAETRGGDTTQRIYQVRLDVDGDHGQLYSSRATVYPRAHAVDDTVLLVYLREGWDPVLATDAESLEAAQQRWMPLRVVARIRDSSGRTVWRASSPPYSATELATSLSWDGRTSDGKAAAAGVYEALVRVSDAAHNRTTYRTSLRVSRRQLQPETTSITYDADAAPRYDQPTRYGCSSCYATCSPGSSDRFPGGLSFGDCPEHSWQPAGYLAPTLAYFGMPVPFAAAPVDSYRVTAMGGPPTLGGAGSGVLATGGFETPIGPGDATVVSPWTPVAVDQFPFLPHHDLAAGWLFTTTTGYDVGTFTVEYVHYVKAP